MIRLYYRYNAPPAHALTSNASVGAATMDTTKSPLPKRKRTPTRGGGGVYPRLASGAAGACDLGTPLTQSTYAGRTYMLKTAAKHAHAQLRGPTPRRRQASAVAAARMGRGGTLAPPGGATPDRRGQVKARPEARPALSWQTKEGAAFVAIRLIRGQNSA